MKINGTNVYILETDIKDDLHFQILYNNYEKIFSIENLESWNMSFNEYKAVLQYYAKKHKISQSFINRLLKQVRYELL